MGSSRLLSAITEKATAEKTLEHLGLPAEPPKSSVLETLQRKTRDGPMRQGKKTNERLGVHIVGAEASDLLIEGALALEMHAFLEDIGLTIHPHPTLARA